MTSHDPITARARELFERASAGLDPGMAYRLRHAREQALQPRARARSSLGLLPAGAFAATVLALGLVWWMPPRPADLPGSDLADLDALVIEEDADLYAWLADAPVATVASGPPL